MTIYLITGIVIGLLTSIYVCIDGLVEGADDMDIMLRMIVMCVLMGVFWPFLLIYLPIWIGYIFYHSV